MKKIVLAMLLVAAVTAVAQTAAAPAQPAPQQSPAPSPAAPPQKKEIKDPAEYNAYVGAVQQTGRRRQGQRLGSVSDPVSQQRDEGRRAGTFDGRLSSRRGNQAKTLETAQKVLQVNPCNIRALALLAFTKQAMATGPERATEFDRRRPER